MRSSSYQRFNPKFSEDTLLNRSIRLMLWGFIISVVAAIVRLLHVESLFIFIGNSMLIVGLVMLVVYAERALSYRSRSSL